MIVFLNGKFVAEEKAVVSVFDRGFLYGDGLFEGIVVEGGRMFRWEQHMERLGRGLKFMKMTLPISMEALRKAAEELIRRNRMGRALLRISLSRGITERGYSPKGAVNPALVMTLHALPNINWNEMLRWRVVTASVQLLAGDPLAAFKTANKLNQVIARGEADEAGAQEAILLNTRGHLAEGTTSNLFWVTREGVSTPPLASGALPGVTRGAVFDLCQKRKIRVKEIDARPGAIKAARGAFLSMSSMGIVEIESLDGKRLKTSPVVEELWRGYRELLTISN
jgi:aminodeoxychorismate lyase